MSTDSTLWDSALRLLCRREHGARELHEKLKRKGFKDEDIALVVHSCQEQGLQSDKRFVAQCIRARIHQGYGPLKIVQELKGKGIEPELIYQELQQEQEHWLEYAMAVWQKKFKGHNASSFHELQKRQRFLFYRGFDQDIIAQVTKELNNEKF